MTNLTKKACKNKLSRDEAVGIIKSLIKDIEDTYGEVSEFYEYAESDSIEDYNEVKADFWRWVSNI